MPNLLVVAAATLIDQQGRILITKRPQDKPMPGLWEFPGGKLEPDETPEEALVRELAEELAITVEIADLAPLTFGSHSYRDFHLLMPVFSCRRWSGTPRCLDVADLSFVAPQDLSQFPMPPADAPLVRHIQDLFMR